MRRRGADPLGDHGMRSLGSRRSSRKRRYCPFGRRHDMDRDAVSDRPEAPWPYNRPTTLAWTAVTLSRSIRIPPARNTV